MIKYQAPEIIMAHFFARKNGILLSEKSFVRMRRRKPLKKEPVAKIEENPTIPLLDNDPQLNHFSYSKPKIENEYKKQKKKYLKPNPNLLPDSDQEIKVLKLKLGAIHKVILKLRRISKYYLASRSRRSEGLSEFRNRFGLQGVPKITPEVVEALMSSKNLEKRLYEDLRKTILNLFLIPDPKDRSDTIRKLEIIIGKFPIKPSLKPSTI